MAHFWSCHSMLVSFEAEVSYEEWKLQGRFKGLYSFLYKIC
jgi:hypothetical protein